jgi:hypothetical protein
MLMYLLIGGPLGSGAAGAWVLSRDSAPPVRTVRNCELTTQIPSYVLYHSAGAGSRELGAVELVAILFVSTRGQPRLNVVSRRYILTPIRVNTDATSSREASFFFPHLPTMS